MSKAIRFEIRSDVAASGGTTLATLPVADVAAARREQDVDGQDRIELKVARSSAAWPAVFDRRVIATLLADGTVLEHRIERITPARTAEGQRFGTVLGSSILLDLDNGIVTRSEANGTTHATFGLMGFTVDALFNIIMAAAPVHFNKGEVGTPDTVIELFTFDIESPLSALRRLAFEAGLEIGVRGDGVNPYIVDLVEQVGGDAPVPELRYSKNLLSVARTSDAAQVVNTLYAFGGNEGGVRADMGDHLFAVEGVTVAGSDVDVVLTDPDVIVEDNALNGRGVRRFRSGVASDDFEVVDSTRATKTIRVTDPLAGPAPDIAVGDLLRFLVSPPQQAGIFSGNLLPDGDIDTTGWTTAPLWSKIDDGDTADEGDTIQTSSSSTTGEVKDCEVSLANPGATVDSSSVHRLKFYAKRSGQGSWGSLVIGLYQAGTMIASRPYVPPKNFAWLAFDLTGAQIAAITDYNNLRIRLTATMQVPLGTDTIIYTVAAAHLTIISNLGSEPAGENLIFVEEPASINTWGRVTSRIEFSDVQLASNLVENPGLRDWTGQVPDGWNVVGLGAEFTKEIRANYTRFGGASAKYNVNEADRGLRTDDIPIFPTAASPYFSAYIVVWNESADGLRFYMEWDDGVDTVQSAVASTTVQDQWVVLVISGVEIPATATVARLVVLANSTASTPWWLDAAQLTQTGAVVDFIDGRSGNILWRRAVRQVRNRSRPAIAYDIAAVDLTALDPTNWPHDELVIGGNVKIVDRDLGERGGFDAGFDEFGLESILAIIDTVRLVSIKRDLLTGADVALEVESFADVALEDIELLGLAVETDTALASVPERRYGIVDGLEDDSAFPVSIVGGG